MSCHTYVDATTARNVQQLRSFLGLVNYYSKFVPNLASILYPPNQFLQKNRKWSLSPDCVSSSKRISSISSSKRRTARGFLGLLNYYSKFVPNLASILYPLNQLLQKNCKWSLSPDCVKAFQTAKEGVMSSQVLVHYDPSLPIKVTADASA